MMNIYRNTIFTEQYGDVIFERAGRLGVPYEILCRVLRNHPPSRLISSPFLRHFSQARGYVFDWGWIVERTRMIQMDGLGLEPAASFGVIPLCLFGTRSVTDMRECWTSVFDPQKPEIWNALPEGRSKYFDYFNNFSIIPPGPYEMFAFDAEGGGCVYGSRRWLSAQFLPVIMPAFIQWVDSGDNQPDSLFALFEQLNARIYDKEKRAERPSKRKIAKAS